jgi:hypothetical protein
MIDGYDVNWEPMSKPAGTGSNVAALAATPDGVGFAVDTSGNAFKTTPQGWEDIGVVNAPVKFYDVYAGEDNEVYIAAGDGRIYRDDDSDRSWTPIGVANETSLRSIDIHGEGENRDVVVMGNNGSIFERHDGDRWEEVPAATSASLFDLSLGAPDIAVGKAGTVIERPRGEPHDAGTSPDGDSFDGRSENDDDNGARDGASDESRRATTTRASSPRRTPTTSPAPTRESSPRSSGSSRYCPTTSSTSRTRSSSPRDRFRTPRTRRNRTTEQEIRVSTRIGYARRQPT